MQNPLATFVSSSILPIVLLGNVFPQQTAAKNSPPAPATTTKRATAKRTPAPPAKPKPVALSTQQDKISYAIGAAVDSKRARGNKPAEPVEEQAPAAEPAPAPAEATAAPIA